MALFRTAKSTTVVLDVANDYSWAIVGTPDLSGLWILSRDKIMQSHKLNSLIMKSVIVFGFDETLISKPLYYDSDVQAMISAGSSAVSVWGESSADGDEFSCEYLFSLFVGLNGQEIEKYLTASMKSLIYCTYSF